MHTFSRRRTKRCIISSNFAKIYGFLPISTVNIPHPISTPTILGMTFATQIRSKANHTTCPCVYIRHNANTIFYKRLLHNLCICSLALSSNVSANTFASVYFPFIVNILSLLYPFPCKAVVNCVNNPATIYLNIAHIFAIRSKYSNFFN